MSDPERQPGDEIFEEGIPESGTGMLAQALPGFLDNPPGGFPSQAEIDDPEAGWQRFTDSMIQFLSSVERDTPLAGVNQELSHMIIEDRERVVVLFAALPDTFPGAARTEISPDIRRALNDHGSMPLEAMQIPPLGMTLVLHTNGSLGLSLFPGNQTHSLG